MKKNEERITPFLITAQDQYEPAVFRQVFDSLTILGFFVRTMGIGVFFEGKKNHNQRAPPIPCNL
jgi:hypothetical protein